MRRTATTPTTFGRIYLSTDPKDAKAKELIFTITIEADSFGEAADKAYADAFRWGYRMQDTVRQLNPVFDDDTLPQEPGEDDEAYLERYYAAGVIKRGLDEEASCPDLSTSQF